MWRRDGLSGRILLATLVVAGVALLIVGLGVLRVGGEAFEALMMAAGESAGHAREMFDQSVTVVFAVAALVAALVAIILAMALARRLARPLEHVAAAASRIADGDLGARVPEEGPAELRALAASYNAMAARLAEQEAVRREFIINASHELRTPLTNLQGYLEALRDGVLPPDPAIFDSLREEVDRLTRLAASLDVLAGAEAGSGVAEDVDVGAVVVASADLVAPALARRSVGLRVEAPPGHVVRARPDELTQVFANLLQNAVRYTPEGGDVAVTVEGIDEGVRVRVANTGPGIPPEDLPRVWERFYRVEKSRDRARGGAGIGLAIVRQLVEAAGGRVGVTSEGGWTTFSVTLPA
jgi:signal transduction histidine kinase